MIFGLIISVAILWGGCNALRELAIYRSLVANQKALMYHSQKATHQTELRHYEEIQRIAERFNIEELRNRKKPRVKEHGIARSEHGRHGPHWRIGG